MSDTPRFLLLRILLTAAALTASLPGPAGAAVQVTAQQPLADANDVPVATSVQATFSEALNPVTEAIGVRSTLLKAIGVRSTLLKAIGVRSTLLIERFAID